MKHTRGHARSVSRFFKKKKSTLWFFFGKAVASPALSSPPRHAPTSVTHQSFNAIVYYSSHMCGYSRCQGERGGADRSSSGTKNDSCEFCGRFFLTTELTRSRPGVNYIYLNLVFNLSAASVSFFLGGGGGGCKSIAIFKISVKVTFPNARKCASFLPQSAQSRIELTRTIRRSERMQKPQ